MAIGTVDPKQLRGVFDKTTGLTKKFLGVLMGNDRLQDEGELQQERATEELRAFRKQVEASAHQKKAQLKEHEQRLAERAKEARS